MPPMFGMQPADYLQVFDNQQFYNNPQAHIRPHSSGANQAAAGSTAPPLELTREQQAEVTRNYQQQLQQQQLQMAQMQAMQQQYAQYAAFQQQQPGQQTPMTSDGEDWLMAGTVSQEALPHKVTVVSPAPPSLAPTDPLEPYRKFATEKYTELLKEGQSPQQAVMEVLNAAQSTGDESIIAAVIDASSRFPEKIDTAQ